MCYFLEFVFMFMLWLVRCGDLGCWLDGECVGGGMLDGAGGGLKGLMRETNCGGVWGAEPTPCLIS